MAAERSASHAPASSASGRDSSSLTRPARGPVAVCEQPGNHRRRDRERPHDPQDLIWSQRPCRLPKGDRPGSAEKSTRLIEDIGLRRTGPDREAP